MGRVVVSLSEIVRQALVEMVPKPLTTEQLGDEAIRTVQLMSEQEKADLRKRMRAQFSTDGKKIQELAKRIAKHTAPAQVKVSPDAARLQLMRLSLQKLLNASKEGKWKP